ncbi:MAG: DNA cytosine methyltransferase [Candidatus Omnitrophica bacterium]|nr:DNA cytosine methyltransferase [Candidatus Omnitrophota bacterium]
MKEYKDGITVLSLFDGISCGRLALERAGIKVKKYFSSEIDPWAMMVSKTHFPDIIRIGDVNKVRYMDGILYTENGNFDIGKIDLLIGGSPCQSFSLNGKMEGFDGKSGLFFQYARLKNECDPTYFLLENVVMKPLWIKTISLYLQTGEPRRVNSSLLSAQKRQRLYWTNLVPSEIKDKGIFLKDILTDFPKRSYRWLSKEQMRKLEIKEYRYQSMYRVLTPEDKAGCVSASGFCNSQDNKVRIGDGIRYLTNEENERLQTLPYGYTSGIPESKRKHCIGNGWTVDVISEFFKKIGTEVYQQTEMFTPEEII